MKMYWLIFLLSFKVLAFDQVIRHENYEQAGADAKNGSIIFSSESTKFGLVTTSFDGRALEFKVQGALKKDQIENVVVTVPVRKITTDSEGRDEKMWDEILEEKTYQSITVSFPIIKHGFEGNVEAQIMVKGRSYPITLFLKTLLKEGKLHVEGKGEFFLKKLNVPDPSIAIAKVRDRFDLNFHVLIE